MLPIIIPAQNDVWDPKKKEFCQFKETKLMLEHSLVSMKKWEQKHHKPFLGDYEKTDEEMYDYIRCMTITQNVDDDIYYLLSQQNIKEIKEYIDDPMTAYPFINEKPTGVKKVMTADVLYYYMFSFNIPIECQKWHINSLIALIRIFDIKNKPSKKMGRDELTRMYSRMNAERRAELHSKG